MRVFVSDSYTNRGQDAMAHNPGNLFFVFNPLDTLPLTCPYSAIDCGRHGADYIVSGPLGWTLIRDGIGMRVVHGPTAPKAL